MVSTKIRQELIFLTLITKYFNIRVLLVAKWNITVNGYLKPNYVMKVLKTLISNYRTTYLH